ncbi:ATP-binding cassette domain-containing protein [Desulfurispira natronophila]|uniref:ABC-type lipoprotein export system ATPase subunit n=1 Tax=Desulfurispira natronophila TaxID=682562 RepID=A0A7W7Y2K5_9BACT|nr:ABC transporter ATP-binding protein [Desulfurispira natronophila]MBB5020888.1 ABC-type lipoprotein export system ATPase subunit [Desulfurispira natronophila]
MSQSVTTLPIATILRDYPFCSDFFESQGMEIPQTANSKTLTGYLFSLDVDYWEDMGTSPEATLQSFTAFFEGMERIANQKKFSVESLTILGGRNKQGEDENITLELNRGDVISIVGPTGSGKSRLLADIEWMARRDTPTGRGILVNGSDPDPSWRFSIEHKLVAQLSQNMNFVMDLTVEEFVDMHAESRLVPERENVIQRIMKEANSLAGEPFTSDTPVTSLSGGQSRALMIADTAFLSRSPIVLIDEIENAGIDRQKALDLLVREEKIVLIATHDPILALMAPRRIVIRNGGIVKVVETSTVERKNLHYLQALDNKMLRLRNRVRQGERIEDATENW